MSLAYEAMMFARAAHRDQRRKYTGSAYADHLAEVAGIAASVSWQGIDVDRDAFLAVCWLHDCVEDQDVAIEELRAQFGGTVAQGVAWLSDLESGNRAQRKAASCDRLARAPGWVQTIKCADIISNTGSIVQFDPKFAAVFLREAQQLLSVLELADPRLLALARATTSESLDAS